jgi:hypothetical protein
MNHVVSLYSLEAWPIPSRFVYLLSPFTLLANMSYVCLSHTFEHVGNMDPSLLLQAWPINTIAVLYSLKSMADACFLMPAIFVTSTHHARSADTRNWPLISGSSAADFAVIQ